MVTLSCMDSPTVIFVTPGNWVAAPAATIGSATSQTALQAATRPAILASALTESWENNLRIAALV
jgi:hypothetical protein